MKASEAVERVRGAIRVRHLAYSTERTYCGWVERFAEFVAAHRERGGGRPMVEAYLSALARQGVSASTQNQAFNAILFLYREVLHVELGGIDALRAKRGQRVRYAPTVEEVQRLLREIKDEYAYPTRLIVRLLYGCGLRLGEGIAIRIKDVDLAGGCLTVRQGKGNKDRVVRLPDSVVPEVKRQMEAARIVFESDARERIPIKLPDLLGKKYPRARFEWGWAWLFPLRNPCRDPRGGEMVRWHCLEETVQRAVRWAGRRAGIPSQVTPHCLRHAYATHAMRRGACIRDLQAAMGHSSIETTMGYLHEDAMRVASPLEAVGAW